MHKHCPPATCRPKQLFIISQLLPTTVLAEEELMEKQLSEALLQDGFLGLKGNRPGKALVSSEWVMRQQQGLLCARGRSHLPEPSSLG